MRLKEEYREMTIINKSKFIACVFPCRNEEEARTYIEQIKKEYRDASHVCTAYMVGENNQIQRSSDNKEPAGTAGVPMLESIKKSGLDGVCACVVRYFGGVKLGAGGLIRAYSGAVSQALTNAPKVEEKEVSVYELVYPYELSKSLEGWLFRNTISPSFTYEESVHCEFTIEDDSSLSQQIQDLTKGSITPTFLHKTILLKEVE